MNRLRVWLELVSAALLPTLEEDHPELRIEFERASRYGLRAVGWVCVGAPTFFYVIGAFALPSISEATMVTMDLLQVILGIGAIALSYFPAMGKYARVLGISTGASIAFIQSVGMARATEFHETVLNTNLIQQFPTIMSVVMLVGMAALPLKPKHTLGLGVLILAMFVRGGRIAQGAQAFEGWAMLPLMASILVVLIGIGLTAVMYQQRATAFLAKLRAEQGFEELKQAQVGLLLARTAAAKSRFAAAMSHEINSPLGALSSAFETLAKLLLSSDVVSDSRKKSVLEDSLSSGRQSYERLNEIAQRMRRLTNLDREEEQLIDLNQLCTDTMDSLRPQITPNARIDIALGPVPDLKCRPTQLSAVVANLIRNANAAIQTAGTIVLKSGAHNGSVWVEVHDDGIGIDADRLDTLFEPDFRVIGGRVSTTNWGLFVSQSIVTGHGGTLSLQSEPGAGTTARVELPLQ